MLFLLVQLSSCIAEPGKWIEYKSTDLGFMIEFPVTPIDKSQTIDTVEGLIKLNIKAADCQNDRNSNNLVYLINCSTYPKSFFDGYTKEDYETFFYTLILGMVKSQITNDGHLAESQVIDFNGCQGREVKIVYNNGLDINTVKFILNGNKIYVLIVTSHLRKVPNPDIQKFFNSFRFI